MGVSVLKKNRRGSIWGGRCTWGCTGSESGGKCVMVFFLDEKQERQGAEYLRFGGK